MNFIVSGFLHNLTLDYGVFSWLNCMYLHIMDFEIYVLIKPLHISFLVIHQLSSPYLLQHSRSNKSFHQIFCLFLSKILLCLKIFYEILVALSSSEVDLQFLLVKRELTLCKLCSFLLCQVVVLMILALLCDYQDLIL